MQLKLEQLYVYKVGVKNVGDIEFTDLHTHISFSPKNDEFQVITYSHSPDPKSLEDDTHRREADRKNLKFDYRSLNPGEQDFITILASDSSHFRVDLRGSGYMLSKESGLETDRKENEWMGAALFGSLGAIVSLLVFYLVNRNPKAISREA